MRKERREGENRERGTEEQHFLLLMFASCLWVALTRELPLRLLRETFAVADRSIYVDVIVPLESRRIVPDPVRSSGFVSALRNERHKTEG